MRDFPYLFVGFVMVSALVGCSDEPPPPNPPDGGQTLQRPDAYESAGGILHLNIHAREVTTTINGDTYNGIYTYDTKVIVGTQAVVGDASEYVGPEWRVKPGDQLVIDYFNDLPPFEFTSTEKPTMKLTGLNQPINLHTHGLTVSPAGNADNILLSIPSGSSNHYVIDIPTVQHEGLYWYHPHIHGLTDDQVYGGLAGHIVVGRADGNYEQFNGLEIVPMMIRYNVKDPDPTNGRLVDASATDVHGTALVTDKGLMIYTVNGLVAPTMPIHAANAEKGAKSESQIWAFTNITGSASYILALEEVDVADARKPEVIGMPLDIVIVSVDGSPMPSPVVLSGEQAKGGYHIPQGGRVALLVQGASDPSKVIRVVQLQNRSGSGDHSAYVWDKDPAKRHFGGGWRDYTRDVLVVGADVPDAPKMTHVDTPATLKPNNPVKFPVVPPGDPAKERTFMFNNVNNGLPGTIDSPNEFPINYAVFPYNRVDQPRLNTTEQWTILNESSLTHPFHFHTQFGQVVSIHAPKDPTLDPYVGGGKYATLQYVTDMEALSPAAFTQDVVGLPPALITSDGNPKMNGAAAADPGSIVMRLRFLNYLGAYVEHCHRLPHEDRGMMSLVRSIPEETVVAISSTPAAGVDTTVTVVKASDKSTIATIKPFTGFSGSVMTAVGDVDGDTLPDVVVASGAGLASAVRIYPGVLKYAMTIPMTDLAPFGMEMNGASIALGDLNGDNKDDIIVGEGAGGSARVMIFDAVGGTKLADFQPYKEDDPTFNGSVNVAAGMVEAGGRVSFFVAPGPGTDPNVKMYNVNLFGDAMGNFPNVHATLVPLPVAKFNGANGAAAGYKGGLSITTGWAFAPFGGFARVITSTLSGPAMLNAYIVGDMDHSNMVSVTGVHRAMPYIAGAERMSMLEGTTTDLSTTDPAFGSGAIVGVYSTPDGAVLVTVPPAGGNAAAWNVNTNGKGFASAGAWGTVGGNFVSGM